MVLVIVLMMVVLVVVMVVLIVMVVVVLMVVLVVVIFLIVDSGCDGVGYSVDDGCVSSGDGSVDSHGSGGGVDGRAGSCGNCYCC